MTEAIRIEILFNSVETQLARRWAFHNVPPVFANRPALYLRITVKAWWQLYHEATSARLQCNRQRWERTAAYPAVALDTPALVASLFQIHQLLDLEPLQTYRCLFPAEESGMALLALITDYYTNHHH
ncbi:hypothetical protein [Spirosoma luteum]|uniref:hypothetical protein n=1 Tax=Spirosoma luteum TaxID=431553 RepID=UPI00037C19A2|nr:hypothetical protein [Spirosoma luteum]